MGPSISHQLLWLGVCPLIAAYGLPWWANRRDYITAALAAAAASGVAQAQGRRDSDAQGSSSGSALTAGSEGEGSIGYHENEYEEVVDEYTLLRRAVDDHDPEAMQLLVQAEQALYPDYGHYTTRPGFDPGQFSLPLPVIAQPQEKDRWCVIS